jgi:hypothetical protein
MELLFKESGRSARIAERFHNRIVRIELTNSALSFHTTLLTIKCKELVAIPVDQIESVKRVLERGIPSFEVNTRGREKMCWFDTTSPDDWESAFATAGVVVEREPDQVVAAADGQ